MKGLHNPGPSGHCKYCNRNITVALAGTECEKNDGPRKLAVFIAAASIYSSRPQESFLEAVNVAKALLTNHIQEL